MKILKIYKENDCEFVLERINELGKRHKKISPSIDILLDDLDKFSSDELDQYKLEVDNHLWEKVINHLAK